MKHNRRCRRGRSSAEWTFVIVICPAMLVASALHADPRQEVGQRKILGWAPEQAAGPPNTTLAGDVETAWASRQPDGQVEWLRLIYAEPVRPRAVLVYETFNPGALIKVSAFTLDGAEVTLWQGSDPTPPGSHKGISAIPVKTAFPVTQVKIYLDAPAVKGWNEIDAVGLRDEQGKTHWARGATASSTYARMELQGRGIQPLANEFVPCGDDAADEAIQRACANLASDRFAVRERATLELIKAGQSAIPRVSQAAEETDIEVNSRAVRILLTLAQSEDEETSQAAVAALAGLTESENRLAARRAGMALTRLELIRRVAQQHTVAVLTEADAAIDADDRGHVTRVNLALTRDTGNVLPLLRDLPGLTSLDLSGAEIDDRDLADLVKLKSLVELKLIHTPLTGRGLSHLSRLPALETLNLFATDVDDAALGHLRELKTLKSLTLHATAVTPRAVAALATALPDCQIEWDGVD